MTTISIGDSLPSIEVVTHTGTIQLSDYAHYPLVIYFYPKDDTPGCTVESKDFRDLYGEFQQAGAEVFGVSRDKVASHQKFCDKFDLPFRLISDSDESLCKIFHVIKRKKLYGREYMGIDRSTFLFNGQGKMAHEWRNVKVPNHASEVLDTLKQLG